MDDDDDLDEFEEDKEDDVKALEELDDEEDDDEDDEEISQQEELEELEEEEQLEHEAEIKALQNKLRVEQAKYKYKWWPFFSPENKMLIKKAKQEDETKVQAKKFEVEAKEKQKQFLMKYSKLIAILLLVVAGLFLIILVPILVASSVDAIFGKDVNKQSKLKSVDGASGSDFYGVRFIYKDTTQARLDLTNDYLSMVQNSTQVAQSSDYTLTISLDTTSLAEFNESEFATQTNEYALIKLLAGVVYEYDNQTTDATTKTLTELLDSIKYFGLDGALNTQFATTISNYICDNDLYVVESNNTVDYTQIENSINQTITQYFTNNSQNRTAKLYVLDQVFTSSSDMLENVEAKEYQAMIFMNKKSVSVNGLMLYINNWNSNFDVKVYNGTTELATKGELIAENDDCISYSYQVTSSGIASQYTLFDTNNQQAFTTSKSLYEIVKDSSLPQDILLTTGEGLDAHYTYNATGWYASFECDECFAVVDGGLN